MTTVADVMTRGVRTMAPGDPVVQAALAMDELNVGVIPVCDGEKLVGMVTDRDIVVRGVAQGGDLRGTKLSDVMSAHVRCARETDDGQRLVGIVSLGDIAAKDSGDEMEVGMSLGDISSPAQPDRSSTPEKAKAPVR